MHETLKNWSAKRSGAFITVTGADWQTGKTVKIPHVREIVPAADGARAIDGSGALHHLLS